MRAEFSALSGKGLYTATARAKIAENYGKPSGSRSHYRRTNVIVRDSYRDISPSPPPGAD